MSTSEVVKNTESCRNLAKMIWPSNPDDIYNSAWLIIREKEIKQPGWSANNPVAYFRTVMRNLAIKWSKESCFSVDLDIERLELYEQPNNEMHEILSEWLEIKADDDDLTFLKNIISLSLICPDVEQICSLTQMSRSSFYKYKKIATNEFYNYYNRTTASRDCVYDFMV